MSAYYLILVTFTWVGPILKFNSLDACTAALTTATKGYKEAYCSSQPAWEAKFKEKP
jgi:hypothetical protein